MRPIETLRDSIEQQGLTIYTATGGASACAGAYVLRVGELQPSLPSPILVGAQLSYLHRYGASILAYDTASSRWTVQSLPGGVIQYRRTGTGILGEYAGVHPVTGHVTVTALPVYRDEREGNDEQLVISVVLTEGGETANRFRRYVVQCDYYHPDRQVADSAAYMLYLFYRQYAGTSSAAPGLTFEGWHAQFVQAQYYAVTGTLPETGGKCYVATTQVTLLNLQPV